MLYNSLRVWVGVHGKLYASTKMIELANEIHCLMRDYVNRTTIEAGMEDLLYQRRNASPCPHLGAVSGSWRERLHLLSRGWQLLFDTPTFGVSLSCCQHVDPG